MRHLLLILVGLAVTAGLGYFIGYDHGFEKAAVMPVQEANAYENASVSDAATVMSQVIGMWQSTEDPKFVREIRNDGVAIDYYENSSDAEGLWMVFTKDIPDTAFTGTLEDGAVYLSIAMGEDEKYYYKVAKADGGTLELVYLDRGGVLSFVRSK